MGYGSGGPPVRASRGGASDGLRKGARRTTVDAWGPRDGGIMDPQRRSEAAEAGGMIGRRRSYLRMVEAIPTQGYLAAALAGLVASLLLRILGYKDAALFVGEWPPRILIMALAYKLLRPSRELPSGAMSRRS